MALLRAVRAFFEDKGFWEVVTPALQTCPSTDTHVHAFAVEGKSINSKGLYLHTSPELAMKKLLVAGLPKIFQICHVFRKGDDSRLHSPEFTMIEWYRAQTGYEEIMQDCEDMLKFCATRLGVQVLRFGNRTADATQPFQRLTVQEAFQKFANINLADFLEDTAGFAKAIAAQGIRVAPDDRWDDLFFRVMAEKIEPHLGDARPTILYEYPASMASLSRKKPEDARWAERFELYICGVEIANAFTEQTNADEIRKRFTQDMALKLEIYGHDYPMDEDFIKAMEHGMPPSGGIALGLDRLAMLFTGADTIDQVLWTGKP